MKIAYPVIMTKTSDKKDTYLIEIPDLKGVTEGYGLEDSIEMARDYIGCAVYDKDSYPSPSAIQSINVGNSEHKNEGESFITLVDVDIDNFRKRKENKAIRKNVSLPAWLANKAAEANLNLSKVLQNALIEILGIN